MSGKCEEGKKKMKGRARRRKLVLFGNGGSKGKEREWRKE